MSTPMNADWLRAAEGNGTVQAVASAGLRLLGARGEPSQKFEDAKRGGHLVQTVVESLNNLIERGKSSHHAGDQDDAHTAAFIRDEIFRAGSKPA